MSASAGWVVAGGGVAVALLLLAWLLRAIARRDRRVNAEIDRALAEMDRRPEFKASPADWPLRESPPYGRGRLR